MLIIFDSNIIARQRRPRRRIHETLCELFATNRIVNIILKIPLEYVYMHAVIFTNVKYCGRKNKKS